MPAVVGKVLVAGGDEVKRGAATPGDGHNVVIHEFAHQLDQAGGPANGAPALPTAEALLRLAPARLHQAVPPAQALPLYVRDKVAQTTEERMAARQAKVQSEAGAAVAAVPAWGYMWSTPCMRTTGARSTAGKRWTTPARASAAPSGSSGSPAAEK